MPDSHTDNSQGTFSRKTLPGSSMRGQWGKRVALALFFLLALAAFLHFRQVRMEALEPHSTAERYIIGQVDFEFPDEEATFLLRQQSIGDVGKINKVSEKQVREIRFDFESYLINHPEWRTQLEKTTFDEVYRGSEALEEALLQSRFTDVRTMQKMMNYHLSTVDYFLFSPPDTDKRLPLPQEFWNQLKAKVFASSDYRPETADFIVHYFQQQSWSLQEDYSAERGLRHKIQEQMPEQYTQVIAGTHIIDPGEKVTPRHIAMLQAMKNAIAKERNIWSIRTIGGSLLLSLILTLLCILYYRIYHPALIASFQKVVLLVSIFVMTLILSKVAEFFLLNGTPYLIELFRYPIIVPFAAILICVLISSEIALFSAAFLTIVLGVSLAVASERFLIINLIASWVAVICARNMHKRKEIFSVLGKVWLSCIPVIIAFNLSANVFSRVNLTTDLFSSLIFIAAIAILVIGLLPLLESVFHVMTDMTLMEYMDPNNELLRRLSVEAPGTYQHCLVAGNLAESAARAIGANGLFCRVATLYHDIGKLFNPHYFTENQLGGFNIHQLLTPLESTQVIMAHVPEGEELARKYRLPQSFIDIIREHHGTTLVYYFYRKQLELAGENGTKVDESFFRYPGPKPHSKESAIIMLADTIEAASRSMEELSEEAITRLVEKLVSEKANAGQLDECQLTFEELGILKRTIVRTLTLTGHLRVKYPEKK